MPVNLFLQLCITLSHALSLIKKKFIDFVPFSGLKMPASTIAAIKLFAKEIATLSNSLSDAVPKGSKDDKIWFVIDSEECENPHETFNWQFDALFAEDCHDSNGCLHSLLKFWISQNIA